MNNLLKKIKKNLKIRRFLFNNPIGYFIIMIYKSLEKIFFEYFAKSKKIRDIVLDIYFEEIISQIHIILTNKKIGEDYIRVLEKDKSCRYHIDDKANDVILIRRLIFKNIEKIKYYKKQLEIIPKIVFLHVPKCAGSSVDKYFIDVLGKQNVLIYDFKDLMPDRNENWINHCLFDNFLETRFISGHFDFNDCNKIIGNKHIITMIREPKSRIISLYYFLKSFNQYTISQYPKRGNIRQTLIKLKKQDILNFLQNNDPYVLNIIDNSITRLLTGLYCKDNQNDPLKENPEKAINIALSNLNKFTAIGIVEKFDLSLKLFANILNLEVPKNTYKENVTLINNFVNKNLEKPIIEYINEEINNKLTKLTLLDDIIYQHSMKKLLDII